MKKTTTRSSTPKTPRVNGHGRKTLAKSTRKTPAKSVSQQTVADPLTEQRELEGELFEDEEAFLAWAAQDTIPGAFPRCLYVGTTLYDIFEVRGEIPFTKAEIESLVVADGEMTMCEFTKGEFQPVAYVYACARDLAAQLQSGKTIETAYHPRGGAFFSQDGGKTCVGVSGSVFKRDQDGSYQFAGGSNLYRLAKAFGRKAKRPVWGWTLDRIKGGIERLQQFHQVDNNMAAFVEKALNSGGDQYRGLARRSGGGNPRTEHRADKKHQELRKKLEAQGTGN